MNTAKFIHDITILCNAGVGVILVPTREPHRAAKILRVQAFKTKKPFRAWNCRDGWKLHSDNGEAPEVTDQLYFPDQAMRRIAALDDAPDGSKLEPWHEGFFAMHYVHWTMAQEPGLVQCIKEYCYEFTSTAQRLFLLVPEGFGLPEELQHDVSVCGLPLPSVEELREKFDETVEASFPEDVPEEEVGHPFSDGELDSILGNAAGMTEAEAANAFARAIMDNIDTWPDTGFEAYNKILLEAKTDVVKRSKVLELMPSLDFDQVGGLDLFKEYIEVRKSALLSEAREFGCDQPRGFLAAGVPGTGKSLLAKATAGRMGLPLISMSVGRLMGGLVGQSEANTRAALSQIEAMAPCAVLLDEVDKSLGGAHQSSGDSGVTQRVLGTILTFMQECPKMVYWMFTANRVGVLPPELVRKGRINELFCVTLPNIVERGEIFKIHLLKRNQNPDQIEGLELAVAGSKGFVGSEIEEAVSEAILQSFHFKTSLNGELILKQLSGMKPLTVSFKKEMDEMMEWAENNARLTSSPCEDATSVAGKPAKKRRRRMINHNNKPGKRLN